MANTDVNVYGRQIPKYITVIPLHLGIYHKKSPEHF